MPSQVKRDVIAVYGATGYTGQRVARALRDAGRQVLASGRDRAGLERLREELGGAIEVWPASLEEPGRLRALAERAGVVIHCAGPFHRTCEPVVRAAIDAGAHYIDVSGEQHSHRFVFETAHEHARGRVALLPGFAFFSALGDVLAARLAEGVERVDSVTVAYAVANWRPSDATHQARMLGIVNDWYEYADGLRPVRHWPATECFDFPWPVGRKRVIPYPTGEAFSVPRHLATRRVSTLLTTSTLVPGPLGALLPSMTALMARTARGPMRPLLQGLLKQLWRTHQPGAMQADPSSFTISVRLHGPEGVRHASAHGRGIYDLTVPMVVFAAQRVMAPDFDLSGALAPAQAVAPAALLERLTQHGLSYELPSPAALPQAG
jgi:short subunit dehydrogenase-like uncharacterized protein